MRRRIGSARWEALLTLAVAVGIAAGGGCLGAPDAAPPRPVAAEPEGLPVLAVYVGEYDGEQFTFTPIEQYIEENGVQPGVSVEALVELPSASYGSTSMSTTADQIALEQVSGTRRTITNGVSGTNPWGPTGECGGTPATGVCVQIRGRNMFSRQAERIYVELTELAPTGMTTSVFIPPPASNTWTAVADFGETLLVPNGAWRYGTIGRNSPTGGGVSVRWAFHGATPVGQSFTFRFTAIVRGLLVDPVRRASLASGTQDSPSTGYPDLGGNEGTSLAAANIAISGDGRYVVFATASTVVHGLASGTHIVRRDMSTGTNTVISLNDLGAPPTGTCSCSNPHVSTDGSVAAYQCSGCTIMTGLGAPTTPQIYVRDLNTSTTILASVDTGGGYADQAALQPRISGDGNVVVFQSLATDLITGHPGGRMGCTEVYRFDRSTLEMIHVSAFRNANFYDGSDGWDWTGRPTMTGANTDACSGVNPGHFADLSSDGSLIAFTSRMRLDDADDPDTNQDVYVYDYNQSIAGLVVVYRVSRSSTGATLTGSTAPTTATRHATISADATTIAFSTDHTNVIGTSTSGRRHVYVRRAVEGADATIERATSTPADAEGATSSFTTPWPALSASGRFVAFWSSYTNLPTPYSVGGTQLFVCDMDAAAAELDRCFVASMAQLTSGQGFTNFGGTVSGTARIGIGMTGDGDAGYVVFQGNPNNWGGMNGAGTQAFVAPFGDPRFQMASPSP